MRTRRLGASGNARVRFILSSSIYSTPSGCATSTRILFTYLQDPYRRNDNNWTPSGHKEWQGTCPWESRIQREFLSYPSTPPALPHWPPRGLRGGVPGSVEAANGATSLWMSPINFLGKLTPPLDSPSTPFSLN